MEVRTFLQQIERLTGTPVHPLEESEQQFLAQALSDDGGKLDWTQFNELLLLVNKDRVETAFYDHFFGRGCMIADIPKGIEKFQIAAMLCFGSFVHAFQTLSKLCKDEFCAKLHDVLRKPEQRIEDFKTRSPKILNIDPIEREKTFLVGYLSAKEISSDRAAAERLSTTITRLVSEGRGGWEQLTQRLKEGAESDCRTALTLLLRYRQRYPDHDERALAVELGQKALPVLIAQTNELQRTQVQATHNQDIYLTWDHMDVYFATSMRKRWEFEELHRFVNDLMGRSELAELNLRYFDPTQSFEKRPVNKGLVEALMLKRAKCTVYSVQDTDTLGKDSELAATLAQGKPVIAYVPEIVVERRYEELCHQDPIVLPQRLLFLLHADEQLLLMLSEDERQFLLTFTPILYQFEQRRVWRTLPDPEAVDQLRREHQTQLDRLCRIVAQSEKRLYDSRAATLKNVHPLRIQVNLATGVANGVLVVRNVPDCAKLLRGVLTNSLQYCLEDNPADQMWYLKEAVSGCVYRVVTQNRKLTNCFWNFYTRM